MAGNSKGAQRHRRNRAAFLAGKSCVRCGSVVNLQIDHVDPSNKDRRTSRHLFSVSAVRRRVELAKCQVLCRPCHKNKTASSRAVVPLGLCV